MLDAIVDYLPSPLDVPPVHGKTSPTAKTWCARPKDDAPFAALAFKIMTDPYVGTLTFIRVYSGKLESGTAVCNTVKGKRERVGRLVQMRADKRDDITECLRGRHLRHRGPQDRQRRATRCASKARRCSSRRWSSPSRSSSSRSSRKSTEDADKLVQALAKAGSVEDPSFRVRTDPETGQTIIAGMGELHLEVIVDRMLREFKVDATVGKPQVAYRETIGQQAEAEGKYIRQSGGKGQYGHVKLRIGPNEAGKGFTFVNSIAGGAIPKEFIPPIEKGVGEALSSRRARQLPNRRRDVRGATTAAFTRSIRRDRVPDRRVRWPSTRRATAANPCCSSR